MQIIDKMHKGSYLKTKVLSGLYPVADAYDGFLIGVFGVVHDGNHVYVGVQMDLPMICANPILLEAETGPSLVGKDILLYYEQAGGFIKYHGKPDKRFFMKGLEGLSDGRGLVIGDSLYFDMKGAQDADMDSAFVACGIHEERLCNALTHSPDLYRVETYY